MPRPSSYTPALGHAVHVAVIMGRRQPEAARRAGIPLRTLQRWLADGRSSDPASPLGRFARRFDLFAGNVRKRRFRASLVREHARSAGRWRRFKRARLEWWMAELGPREFWRRRKAWAEARGREDAAALADAKLAELDRQE